MLVNLKTQTYLLLYACVALLCFASCSKDSDLLTDAVQEKDESPFPNGEDNPDQGANVILLSSEIKPLHDAYVENEIGINNRLIRIEEDHRTCYFMFDLSNLPGKVVSASLEFIVDSDAGNGKLDIYHSTSNSWTENNISANNAPQQEVLIGSVNTTFALNKTNNIDLNSNYLTLNRFSVILTHSQGNDFAISSKENDNNRSPRLLVTYEAPEGTVPDNSETDTNTGGNDNNSDNNNSDTGGSDSNTGGDNSDTGGDNTNTGGDNTNTGGDNTNTGGDNTNTGGDNTNTGGDNTNTGGDNTNTGGDNTNTGGDNTDTGGDNTNTDGNNNTGGDTNTGDNNTNTDGNTGNDTGGDTNNSEGNNNSGGDETNTNGNNDTPHDANPDGFYVTPNGSNNGNGLSEANAWSLQYAFRNAKAGDVIYIKAGNYGSIDVDVENSGTSSNPIKFIGYTNTPGDIASNQGSTFEYGDTENASIMPLLKSNNVSEIAIRVPENHIHIENFQINGYKTGVFSGGNNNKFKNIICIDQGSRTSFHAYDGFGIIVNGNANTLENCYVENPTAEAIRIFGSNNSRVNYCKVYADDNRNPTDYYVLLSGGTYNTIVENSLVQRAQHLDHNGHGFDLKDLAQNNTIRKCTAINTVFEFNFSGVKNNLMEDCTLIGSGTNSNQWQTRLVINNGANNNTVKNMHIENTWAAIHWGDYDDGYIGDGGDRDEVSLGYDNTFDGITVKNCDRILSVGGGTEFSAKASRNTFTNCDFDEFTFLAVAYYKAEDISFRNCSFANGENGVTLAKGDYEGVSAFDASFQNCTWSNVSFTPPQQ